MLTRKALIVHCLTSPPSARLCVFSTHSGAKEKGFGLAYDTQLASGKTEIFEHISKMFPRQKGRKCFFVVAFCGVFVVVTTAMQNGGRHGSLIILIVSKALVRIGQSGLDVE